MPSSVADQPSFRAVTIIAGIVVGLVNFLLARALVGRRLAALAGRMRTASTALEEAIALVCTESMNADEFSLRAPAPDAFGEAADSFNRLVRAATEARQQQLDMVSYLAAMARHATPASVSRVIADNLRAMTGADRAVVEHCAPGEAEPGGWHLTQGPDVVATLAVADAGEVIAVITLGFAGPPAPEVVRILDKLAAPTEIGLRNALLTDRLHRLATFDALTGCHNRRAGFDILDAAWTAHTPSEPVAVLVVDVDHFKSINDTYGHGVGDAVLAGIAAALLAALPDDGTLVPDGR